MIRLPTREETSFFVKESTHSSFPSVRNVFPRSFAVHIIIIKEIFLCGVGASGESGKTWSNAQEVQKLARNTGTILCEKLKKGGRKAVAFHREAFLDDCRGN